jgi:hypothetical protein
VSYSSSPLSRFWPYAIVVAVLIGALTPIAVSAFSSGDANHLGGDFASFYVAGEIVLDGDIDRLYDPAIQQARQARYHSEPGEYLYFAYPPFVAMVYASIAWLPYPVAFAVHSLASLAVLAVAALMIVSVLTLQTNVRRATLVGTALALLSYPISTAVLGGQNTTFTLTLVLVAFAVIPSISSRFAGIAAGALFYKPQFGLLVVAALAVGRKWQSVVWAGVTTLSLYLVVVPWLGWLWPEDWLAEIALFGTQNQQVNGFLMVNALGWWSVIAPGVTWVALGTIAVVTIPTIVLAHRQRLLPSSVGPMSAWLVIAAASALFYDAGVALVLFGMFVVLTGRPRWLIPVVMGVSWTQLFARQLGWSPLFVVVVVLWAYQTACLFGIVDRVSHSVGTLASPGRHDTEL